MIVVVTKNKITVLSISEEKTSNERKRKASDVIDWISYDFYDRPVTLNKTVIGSKGTPPYNR